MQPSEGTPVTIDLSAPGSEKTLKDNPFKIKEGAKFTMSAKFKVQHEILSGLHYVQLVKRKGVRVSKDSEMIVGADFCKFPRQFPLTLFDRGATRRIPTHSPHTSRNVSLI